MAYVCNRVGWNKFLGAMEKEGLEGNVRKRGLPSLCLKFIPGRDYSNAEGMLAMMGVTSLLVNSEGRPRSPERVKLAKIASLEKSIRPGAILCIKVKSPRCLQWDMKMSHSRWRASSYETWRPVRASWRLSESTQVLQKNPTHARIHLHVLLWEGFATAHKSEQVSLSIYTGEQELMFFSL